MNIAEVEVAAITSTNEIATLPPAKRAAVVLNSETTRAELAKLVKNSAGIVSVLNNDGREEAHRAAMNLKGARIAIEKTGKQAREDATAFSKAVIALEKELISVIEPEETRVLALRDEWDEKIAAEKAAKIAAERQRVEGIQERMTAVRNLPAATVGKSAAEISQMIYELAGPISQDDAHAATFDEFADDYKALRSNVLDALAKIEAEQLSIEQAAREAEAVRLAEIERIEAERAELARLRAEQEERERLAKIESDRIAAEQAAEAKRLAGIAAAQQAEQARVAAEVKRQMEAQQAEIAAAQRKLAEQQAAADKRDADAAAALKAAEAAALAKEQDAQRREDDHGPALEMNAAFDAERAAEALDAETERERCQAMADQYLADSRESAADERKCGLPAGALRDLADHLDDIGLFPDDSEIVSEIRAMFMTQWGMDRDQADVRMSVFNYQAALAAFTGEHA